MGLVQSRANNLECQGVKPMSNTQETYRSLEPTANQVNAGLLLVRVAGSLSFLYHGSTILFGAFGGPGLQGFSAFTHMPIFVAFLVGLAQFAGGIALITGVLARLGAACIAIVMAGAILLVHLPHGFDGTKEGMEFALAYFLLAISLIVTGAGRYTLVSLIPAGNKLRHASQAA
jgi:putative oxidoreductase